MAIGCILCVEIKRVCVYGPRRSLSLHGDGRRPYSVPSQRGRRNKRISSVTEAAEEYGRINTRPILVRIRLKGGGVDFELPPVRHSNSLEKRFQYEHLYVVMRISDPDLKSFFSIIL